MELRVSEMKRKGNRRTEKENMTCRMRERKRAVSREIIKQGVTRCIDIK